MNQELSQTAIVTVEITKPNKAPEIKYITIGGLDAHQKELELALTALNYVKTSGRKEVTSVIYANSEQYRIFLENNLIEFANSQNDGTD